MLGLPPARSENRTRVAAVIDAIRRRIASRAMGPAARLPSVRSLAAALGVSKSTVVEAYDRLIAEGAVTSRRGSGFFVAGHAPPLSLAEVGPRLDRQIDPLWITRQSLDANSDMLMPGCGWLPPSWMPDESLRRALRHAARGETSVLTHYSSPAGHGQLRQHLSWRLAERGIHASPDQIVLTDSGTNAIDLLCRFLIEPGNTVLIDDPCYFNFHALLRAHRASLVSVPYTPNGPDLEAFSAILAEHRPRLYITNATLHNPTGATITPAVAHRLLKLADQHDLIIIEDDIFADFEHEPASRLAAFDGLQRVISIGSFSKTLSSAIRCGYAALRADWVEPLIDLKLATCFSNARLSAEIVHGALTDGTYRRHINGLHTKLADARGAVMRRLRSCGLTPWIEPRGGMFLWARLPDGLDAADIARHALIHGVVMAPGNVFSLSQCSGSYLRFNVAQSNHPRIFEVLAQAMDASANSTDRIRERSQ